mmetsp:Transcript_6124/g.9225  ORF Transcript_6124/g.9225 Transcript_6124/m.9225 type:complete len:220 (+) Transcript_6124:2-661(+)
MVAGVRCPTSGSPSTCLTPSTAIGTAAATSCSTSAEDGETRSGMARSGMAGLSVGYLNVRGDMGAARLPPPPDAALRARFFRGVCAGLAGGWLTDLEVTQLWIGEEGAARLAELILEQQGAVQVGARLVSLDLSENRIGERGCVALARAIACIRTLRSLSLKDNPIGYRGVMAVVEAAKTVGLGLSKLDVRRAGVAHGEWRERIRDEVQGMRVGCDCLL